MPAPAVLHAHEWLSSVASLTEAGKVTHGIGTIAKVLIGFGILIGVVVALVLTALFRRK